MAYGIATLNSLHPARPPEALPVAAEAGGRRTPAGVAWTRWDGGEGCSGPGAGCGGGCGTAWVGLVIF